MTRLAESRAAVDAERRRQLGLPAPAAPPKEDRSHRVRKTVAEMTPEQREKRRLRSWRWAEKKRREKAAA